MNHFASVLLAFPDKTLTLSNEPYHKAVRQHIRNVDSLMRDKADSLGNVAAQLLQHVSPAVNSISYLALLQVLLNNDNAVQTNASLLSCVAKFLITFDARQIRYVGSTFSELLKAVTEGGLFPHSVAVDLVATALLRVDPTGSVLTSHHLSLVNVAYSTDNIEPVLPVIEKTVVFYAGMKGQNTPRYSNMKLPPPAYVTVDSGLSEKLTSGSVLQYDLLCAVCFIQRRDWQRAFDALERVISHPTKDNGCSKIMAEAYNKWLLVGLLLHGKTPTLPPLTFPGPQKMYSTLGKPYASIAKAFEQDTAESLKAEFETLGTQFWAEESNLGLMRLVLDHYQRWKIIQLRDVYTKISIPQIRTLTQSAETAAPLQTDAEVLQLVRDMISGGMLHGVINESSGTGEPAYLTFTPPTEELTEAEFAAQILQTAERIKDLAPVVKATNERLWTSREYLRSLSATKRNNAFDAPSTPFDMHIEDEDLMMGMSHSH